MDAPYGKVAISGHAWLDERAQAVLNRGIPALPELPGDQAVESPQMSDEQQEECHDGKDQ